MYLIFDTETTGKPKRFGIPYTDTENWPRLVQLSWQLHDAYGKLLSQKDLIIYPDGFTIPFNAEQVHGISTERAIKVGIPLQDALDQFEADLERAELIVAHNIEFDYNVMGSEYVRTAMDTRFLEMEHYCTMVNTTDFVAIPKGRGGGFKWPSLTELYQKLFHQTFEEAHNAAFDVAALARAFFGLIEQKVIPPRAPKGRSPEEVLKHLSYEAPDLDIDAAKKSRSSIDLGTTPETEKDIEIQPFVHLQVHSHHSILHSNIKLPELMRAVKEQGMETVAITDLANLFGAFNAINEGKKAGVKVIIGCEIFLVEDHTITKFTRENPDKKTSLLLLVKNQVGYENLMTLVSKGWIEGNYGLYPRVSKHLLETYHEGLVATSGPVHSLESGLHNGEIPELLLNQGEEAAEAALKWYKGLFGEDFYLQLQRHGLASEEKTNEFLLKMASKHELKTLATNNVFYLRKEDAEAQEILFCVRDAIDHDAPVGVGRSYRKALPNHEYYLKSAEEMSAIFADVPEVVKNAYELADSLATPTLQRDIQLPKTTVPEGFESEIDYLKHLSYEGVKSRYGEITDEISSRLDHEISIIKEMGFAGYFLIVADLVRAAKDRGVWVGPGRGSAAGSAVAYCIGITNIDPIKYNLLFERFLNPERVSMPDIDIDFEDRYRGKVIEYTVERYGKNQVAQIVTYGTMAPKNAIRDVGRTLKMPISTVNSITKLIPARPGVKFKDAYKESPELEALKQKDPQARRVLEIAEKLEGNIRNLGLHAAGVIIAPDDITKYVPVSTSKDSDLMVTQFDKNTVEDAGMLKMDILGLRNLSIIQDTLKLIKHNKGISIDIDEIPLDDPKTFELYQKGETVGTFQFESTGMRRYLKELKPTSMEDLIAMNALYRPGPLQFIPNFIDRKHGREKVEYPSPLLEPLLKDTYGIMVYQEQIMQTAQILAGYSLGQADLLRRAMGKKKKEVMAVQEEKFVEGCQEKHGIPDAKAKEIFAVMAKFAEYGFNRSHSAAYSVLAYQTAYLKAHFPGEYMAAVLTNHMSYIEKITYFMEECRAMGLPVMGPDVNESSNDFNVTKDNKIRFGLEAIKGAGETAVKNIIAEREANGKFRSLFDFFRRMADKGLNKKTIEVLALAGGFDNLNVERSAFFQDAEQGSGTFLDTMFRYANAYLKAKAEQQTSLFSSGDEFSTPEPRIPKNNQWSELEKLNREKEVLGFYLSGHPLDNYDFELTHFCSHTLENAIEEPGKTVQVAGIITDAKQRQSQRGDFFGIYTLEDKKSSLEFTLFKQDYIKFNPYMEKGSFLYLTCAVEERYNKPGQFELRVLDVLPLSELRERKIKNIRIDVDIEKLDQGILQVLEEFPTTSPGQCAVQIRLLDKVNKQEIDLYPYHVQLEPSNELMKKIASLDGIEATFFNGNAKQR